MKLYYNYGKMLEKAEEIRLKTPQMLEENDWDSIQELLYISEEIWYGPSADSYRKLVDALLTNRDEKAKEVIAILPDTIEADVKHMQDTDKRAAEFVRQNFSSLF